MIFLKKTIYSFKYLSFAFSFSFAFWLFLSALCKFSSQSQHSGERRKAPFSESKCRKFAPLRRNIEAKKESGGIDVIDLMTLKSSLIKYRFILCKVHSSIHYMILDFFLIQNFIRKKQNSNFNTKDLPSFC